MALKTAYTLTETYRLAGFKNRYMLDYLARNGIVKPSIRPQPGRGNRRLFSFSDVLLLKAINKLLEKGISVKKLKDAQKKFSEINASAHAGSLPNRYLVTDGVEVFYIKDAPEIIELSNDGQLSFAFVIDMQPLNQEVYEGAKKLSQEARQQIA